MEYEEFKSELIKQLKKIDIEIDEEKVIKFYKYMNLLIEWNKKINLTAIIEPNDIILKHFVDSLTIVKDIGQNGKLADIGTGAGFPGIPIKIFIPEIDVTLIDSLNKRINFLNEVIEQLELKNIVAVHGRTEDLGKDKKYREKFDYVTSRAVANLSVLSEYVLPLVKIGGKCICMKGSNVEEEVEESKKELKALIEKYNIDIIAIGNGTASRESEKFVSDMIKEIDREVQYIIVSEAGASVYSASELANEEHPDINVSLRGAISIARRLQDPLAELVKIDPKSIGVGQYQHDLNQKKLEGVLDGVVEDSVNSVGVDLNTASYSLLEHIAGISKTIAKNIVAYREENGDFTSRAQIKKVKRL